MSRERDKRRTEPPSPLDEEKLAPGPFEELFLKPARPLDLDDTSPGTRDVFPREARGEAPAPHRDRESVIFSPFTPTSPVPPPFTQPEPPPAQETGVSKPAPPSFAKLVEELVPVPDDEEEPPPPRRRRIPAIAWALPAVLAVAAGGAWLLRDRLSVSPAASTTEVEPVDPQGIGAAPSPDTEQVASEVADAAPAGEPATPSPAGLVPEPVAAPPPQPPPLAPAAALAGVSWRAIPAGTEVAIRADGFLAPQRVQVNVLTSPPRVLVRLAQVAVGTVGEQRTVGTGGIERIRFGYHGELSPPQLYVVLDLSSPAVALVEHALDENTVRLVLRRPRTE